MHAMSSYRGNRHTNPQTGPITIHCAAALLAHSVIKTNTHIPEKEKFRHTYVKITVIFPTVLGLF